ncbi:MAG TPA: transposase [Bacillota bacterium]|nr:transposase [Bacillota bacterium]HQB80985.1 transposase [Bacillota bacterium]
MEADHTIYPDPRYQRCGVHFARNALSVVPRGKMKLVAAMLRANHVQEDRQTALNMSMKHLEKHEMKIQLEEEGPRAEWQLGESPPAGVPEISCRVRQMCKK